MGPICFVWLRGAERRPYLCVAGGRHSSLHPVFESAELLDLVPYLPPSLWKPPSDEASSEKDVVSNSSSLTGRPSQASLASSPPTDPEAHVDGSAGLEGRLKSAFCSNKTHPKNRGSGDSPPSASPWVQVSRGLGIEVSWQPAAGVVAKQWKVRQQRERRDGRLKGKNSRRSH